MTKLIVGNLPSSATAESVRSLFSRHGTIESLVLINDRDTGRPRCFGYIEMSAGDAGHAMEALDGQDFAGRFIKVNEAQVRERSVPRRY